jgi:uncharacterized protein YbjQ (UPF0145 family)
MTRSDEFEEFVEGVLADESQVSTQPRPTTEEFVNLLERFESESQPQWAVVRLCTTPTLPGSESAIHVALVSARVVLSQSPWKNLKTALGTESASGRSETLEADFLKMEQECFRQLKAAAYQKGADAVVGVSLQFGETTGEANLFFATATGTAIITETNTRA